MIKKRLITGLLISLPFFYSFAGTPPFAKKTMLSFETEEASLSRRRGSDKLFEVGGQVSMLKLLGGTGTPMLIGFGVNGLFSLSGERSAFYGDFSYYLPGTQTNSGYANAHSSLVTPSQVDIVINTKISGAGLRFGYRKYLINDITDDGFKLYFQVGAGLLLFKGSSSSTGYDATTYYPQYEPESTAVGFTIGGGFGGEYRISEKLSCFGEANINIPANTVNGQAVEVEIPVSAQIVIGARFHF